MLGSILSFLEYYGFFALMSIPYFWIVTFVFNLLQIPFAAISRKAVYCFMTIRIFLISLYFSVCAYAAPSNGFSIVPFLILFSVGLFLSFSRASKSAETDGESAFVIFSSVLSVVLFLCMSLSGYLPAQIIVIKYLSLYELATSIPLVGNLIFFLTPLFCILAALLSLLAFFIFLLFTFFELIKPKSFSKNQER